MRAKKLGLRPRSRIADDLAEQAAKKAYDATVAKVRAARVAPAPSYAALATVAGLPASTVAAMAKADAAPQRRSVEERLVALETAVTRLLRQPDRGPKCICGCYWVEHEAHMDEEFRQIAGVCLSCGCTVFVAESIGARAGCCGGACAGGAHS